MAIKRNEFEQVVLLKQGSEYRRALMLYALVYTGVSWKGWSDIGEKVTIYYPPNDVIFACLYANYKAAPTQAKFVQMAFMLSPRNGNEAGYMIDPAHKTSGARKAARLKIADIYSGKASGSENWLAQVYSEMWLANEGSLRGWTAAQPTSMDGILQQYEQNKATVKNSPELYKYFETLRKKFCGEGIMQTSSNKANANAFKEDEVGFNVTWDRVRNNVLMQRPVFNN